jgi:hypothetical protein
VRSKPPAALTEAILAGEDLPRAGRVREVSLAHCGTTSRHAGFVAVQPNQVVSRIV